jgi:hypothetical protein
MKSGGHNLASPSHQIDGPRLHLVRFSSQRSSRYTLAFGSVNVPRPRGSARGRTASQALPELCDKYPKAHTILARVLF